VGQIRVANPPRLRFIVPTMPAVTSRAPRAALVTCADQPILYAEEREVLPLLRARRIDAVPLCWDDPWADWASFDAVVIRSTWDYFRRYDEFCAWLDKVERQARVWNPPSLVRWNTDKRYLRDLEARGVRVVPTVYCEPGVEVRLDAVLDARGWTDAIIKPAVSGGAYRTHRVSRGGAGHDAQMSEILGGTAALVQPFMPEIQIEGEWSLHYFDGAFSHAVLKVPAGSDYRIQPQYGGTFKRVEPPAWMRAEAEGVLAALPVAPLYARIDGVRRGEEFFLMEAELVEPYLYMAAAPEAIATYAGVIERVARLAMRGEGEERPEI
jgi:hypothetical protein